MMQKNKIINIIVLMILSSLVVNAFGVTLPYHPKDGYGELAAIRGESVNTIFSIQNGEEEDIRIKASVAEGQEIAELIKGDEFYLSSKSGLVEIPVKITIPRKSLEEQYLVRIKFTKMVSNSGGGTFLTSGIEQRFYVKVIDLSLIQRLNRVLPFKVQDAAGFSILLIVLVVLTLYLRKKDSKKK